MNVHSTAIIDPSAQIASSATVGAYAIIGPGVVLGENCRIHPHAVLEYTELGSGCEVYPFASIGLPPQHLGYKGEPTKVIVGDNTVFRENSTVHRGTVQGGGITRIGSLCYLMAVSHVAHDCIIGNNVIIVNGSLIAGHVEVGDRCFVSGLVAVHQFVRVGKGAILSGGAMVTMDVPPFSIIQGDRAILRGINLVGLRRGGIKRESLGLLKEAYRVLFHSGLRLEEALAHSIFKSEDTYVKDLKDFMSKPKRGFVRPSEALGVDKEEATA